jgi:hypothetical protein
MLGKRDVSEVLVGGSCLNPGQLLRPENMFIDVASDVHVDLVERIGGGHSQNVTHKGIASDRHLVSIHRPTDHMISDLERSIIASDVVLCSTIRVMFVNGNSIIVVVQSIHTMLIHLRSKQHTNNNENVYDGIQY